MTITVEEEIESASLKIAKAILPGRDIEVAYGTPMEVYLYYEIVKDPKKDQSISVHQISLSSAKKVAAIIGGTSVGVGEDMGLLLDEANSRKFSAIVPDLRKHNEINYGIKEEKIKWNRS